MPPAQAEGGRWSRPPAFPSGSGLVSTVDDYHTYLRMLLNHGTHEGERILPQPAVELMTTNRLTPEQKAARTALARDNEHLSFGQGQHGGWGFGMAVRAYRSDYAPLGQFGWDGGTGTTAYADPHNQLTGILLTQVGLSTPDPASSSTTSGPPSTRQSTTDAEPAQASPSAGPTQPTINC
ncbi:Beta-lactamase [Streptomyces yunnanensis]|uniref:Beta-lactamase n=1 Tax=Streptomyces yunnanensis TaxID=156453 RepID=A0A9X8R071_9ACTN|nr:Beta-lactamase [Streptomyces yunnanensis]